uniref:Uncharacterized protein n=1 Tax=Romanomermis culicivorax TaxID=13658 RepID=A0A915JGY0_ROMCU
MENILRSFVDGECTDRDKFTNQVLKKRDDFDCLENIQDQASFYPLVFKRRKLKFDTIDKDYVCVIIQNRHSRKLITKEVVDCSNPIPSKSYFGVNLQSKDYKCMFYLNGVSQNRINRTECNGFNIIAGYTINGNGECVPTFRFPHNRRKLKGSFYETQQECVNHAKSQNMPEDAVLQLKTIEPTDDGKCKIYYFDSEWPLTSSCQVSGDHYLRLPTGCYYYAQVGSRRKRAQRPKRKVIDDSGMEEIMPTNYIFEGKTYSLDAVEYCINAKEYV